MALIRQINPAGKSRANVHGQVECGFSSFTARDGKRYLQLDTYGSAERQEMGKISQSIQFDEGSAAQLKALIEATFPRLGRP